MNKNYLTVFLLCCYHFVSGQLLSGIVFDQKTDEPIVGASVYFDGSSHGTTTDFDGRFELSVQEYTNARLIVSYMGYSAFKIDAPSTQEIIRVGLRPKVERLNEVVLTSDPFSRKQKLAVFRLEFLGESKAALLSSIVNEDDIKLYFNTRENTLEAYSDRPILIRNDFLGYQISFDIQGFKIYFKERSLQRTDNIKFTILSGFSRFTDMVSQNNKQFTRRRVGAFQGSPTHFMRTIWKNNWPEENFSFRANRKSVTPDELFQIVEVGELGLKKVTANFEKLSVRYNKKYKFHSTLEIKGARIFTIDKYGNYNPYQNLYFGGYMAGLRIGDMLPNDYEPPVDSDFENEDLWIAEQERIQTALKDAQKESPAGTMENQGLRTIKGIVFNNTKPMPNVDIQVLGRYEVVRTDRRGRYRIKAAVGDMISFDYLGMETVVKRITDTTDFLNASLKVKVKELQNVTVTKRKNLLRTEEEKFQEYNVNTDLIKSNFGILDKKIAPYAMHVIDKNDMVPGERTVLTMIEGMIPGARFALRGDPFKFVRADHPNAALYLRPGSSLKPAIYEVDGAMMEQVPLFLDPETIERIAVIPSTTAMTKYGSMGTGGVVVINTKTANFSPSKNSRGQNPALAKGNVYKGDAIGPEQVRKNCPDYLKELYNSESIETAREIFNAKKRAYSGSAIFFLDSYNYFMEKKDISFAEELLEQQMEIHKDNVSLLRAMAFAFDQQGRLDKSRKVYSQIFRLQPTRRQSYRNLAHNYEMSGNHLKALNLYVRYNRLVHQGYFQDQQQGAHPILATEFENLLETKFSEVSSRMERQGTGSEKLGQTRMIFEWNDEQAGLELQFVNPSKKFYRWSCNKTSDPLQEPRTIKEFWLDETDKGKWQINANYLGNESGLPIYVKVSVYRQYGTPKQQLETKLYRLHLKNVNQQLFPFNNLPISKIE